LYIIVKPLSKLKLIKNFYSFSTFQEQKKLLSQVILVPFALWFNYNIQE